MATNKMCVLNGLSLDVLLSANTFRYQCTPRGRGYGKGAAIALDWYH